MEAAVNASFPPSPKTSTDEDRSPSVQSRSAPQSATVPPCSSSIFTFPSSMMSPMDEKSSCFSNDTLETGSNPCGFRLNPLPFNNRPPTGYYSATQPTLPTPPPLYFNTENCSSHGAFPSPHTPGLMFQNGTLVRPKPRPNRSSIGEF